MRVDRRSVIGLALLAASQTVSAQSLPPATDKPFPAAVSDPVETIDLWPAGAPGMPTSPPVETVVERSVDPTYHDRAVYGITRPRMVVFRPKTPNGGAVLITPGGGYKWVVVDKEGYELGRWLAERGYTVFVLFYRLPGERWAAGADVVLQDTQRAVRLIRFRANELGVSPTRIGVMGFSAGGHASADLAARYAASVYAPVDRADAESAAPDFAATIYPVVTMMAPYAHKGSREKLLGTSPTSAQERLYSPHLNIANNAPPHFILHAEDDDAVPVENALMLHAALKAKGIAVEMHLFAQGGHGFGLRRARGKPVEAWPHLFLAWAQSKGF
jgi:acetyl esterase/lipase